MDFAILPWLTLAIGVIGFLVMTGEPLPQLPPGLDDGAGELFCGMTTGATTGLLLAREASRARASEAAKVGANWAL